MTSLDGWLQRATRLLSKDSALRVRAEIEQHYESAREAATGNGATAEDANRLALRALGDPTRANRAYRRVLLTSAEARVLREGCWETQTICSHRLAKTLLLSMPGLALLAATVLFLAGATGKARLLLIGGMGMALLFVAPFLPVYTPSRGRVVRYGKWVVLIGMLVLAFGQDALKFSWLMITSLWPMGWIEWRRVSIRRKLPIAQWPKHLYL
jgi:hypothetical protein